MKKKKSTKKIKRSN